MTHTLRLTLVASLLASLLFAVAPAPRAYAASYVVNTLNDNTTSGDSLCTLREAIASANNAGNGDCGTSSSANDTITFSVSGTITLGSTLPTIVSGQGTLTINGGSTVTISGNNLVRVMYVNSSANLTLQNLTIANGYLSAGDGSYGGGIYNIGTLTITNSTFSGNSVNGSWGGIAGGGGIANFGTLSVTKSTFSGNSATASAEGGGIYNNATLTITNSTFSGNSASGTGGGISDPGGTQTTVTNSTFSGNSATGSGGGIYSPSGTATLKNAIVANSTAGGDCSGTVSNGGNNIVEDNTCGFTGGVDPNLGTLTGSPAYFPLNTGSAAIDAGSNTVCAAAPVSNASQNGVTRPTDGDGNGTATCDIGSYEAPAVSTATATATATATNTATATATATATNTATATATATATNTPTATAVATNTPTPTTASVGAPAAPVFVPPSGSQSVGASGGTFNCSSRWTLNIPADVLPNNSSLQCGAFDPNVTAGAPTGFRFMGQMINVLILDDTGAARRTFSPPLTVCFTYTDADLLAAGGDPNNFVIQTADIGGAWTTMTTTVNTTTRQACATTDHLTLFALSAKTPTSLPVTGQNFTPFIIIAALIIGLLIVGAAVAFAARRRMAR